VVLRVELDLLDCWATRGARTSPHHPPHTHRRHAECTLHLHLNRRRSPRLQDPQRRGRPLKRNTLVKLVRAQPGGGGDVRHGGQEVGLEDLDHRHCVVVTGLVGVLQSRCWLRLACVI